MIFSSLSDRLRRRVLRRQLCDLGLDDLSQSENIDNIVLLLEERCGQGSDKGLFAGGGDVSSVTLASVDELHGLQRQDSLPHGGTGDLEGLRQFFLVGELISSLQFPFFDDTSDLFNNILVGRFFFTAFIDFSMQKLPPCPDPFYCISEKRRALISTFPDSLFIGSLIIPRWRSSPHSCRSMLSRNRPCPPSF